MTYIAWVGMQWVAIAWVGSRLRTHPRGVEGAAPKGEEGPIMTPAAVSWVARVGGHIMVAVGEVAVAGVMGAVATVVEDVALPSLIYGTKFDCSYVDATCT